MSSAHTSTHVGHPEYHSGFGSEHASEALPGALPVGQNSPQICPYGLYAEQLSGTSFTVPRVRNQRTWLYRIRPSVVHERFVPIAHTKLAASFGGGIVDPTQMRWLPPPLPPALGACTDEVGTAKVPKSPPAGVGAAAAKASASASARASAAAEATEDVDELDWVDGLFTMAGAGDPTLKTGLATHMYTCNKSMIDTCLFNSDGDFLIVPQEGTLHIQTEMGFMDVAPKEICVIPRGIRFRVAVDGPSRGYVLEVWGGHFQLPDLGPIGANGLANARDFLYPVAAYEDRDVDYVIINKFGGHLFSALSHHSPFDIVAWHGNYAPFKYDLTKFNTMNSVSFDHPDPSIYCVLTVPGPSPGEALTDFVIFPPRFMVMDHTFRPPYYHRNIMTEFMGMVWGKYDAKVGFQPGGASLHSCMTSHGPDADTFLKASAAELKPERFDGGLAFMFETTLMMKLTPWAVDSPQRDLDYPKCWSKLPRVFDPATRVVKSLTVHAHPTKGAAHGVAHGPLTGTGESVLLAAAHKTAADDGVTAAPAAKRSATVAAVEAHGEHASEAASEPAAAAAASNGKAAAGAGATGKRKRGV